MLFRSGTRVALEVYQLMKTELGEAGEPAPPGTVGSSTMPHKRNPQLADDCITIGAQLRALVPLALEGMLHDHENDGAHSAMLDDALQRACALTGDLLVRLEVILSGLVVDPARMRANLDLTGGMISSEGSCSWFDSGLGHILSCVDLRFHDPSSCERLRSRRSRTWGFKPLSDCSD